jgi:hypothetical protein
MTELHKQLVRDLAEVRQQWRFTKLLEGALLAIAGAAGVVIVLVAFDNVFKLETAGRCVLALVLWGGLGLLLLRLVVSRWIEDRRDDFFAALVEHKHPELHNQLINALQLGRGNVDGSPAIVEAIVSDAARATGKLEMHDCLDWQPVKRSLLWTGAAVAAIVAYAILLTPQFTNGLGRVLLPVASIKAYTSTIINEGSITPANGGRYPEGASVEISVRVGGDKLPDTATIFRRVAGGTWHPTPMELTPLDSADQKNKNKKSTAFRFVAADIDSDFQFYIAAGDDRSESRSIEIVKRPRIDTLSITITYPAYTGLDAQEIADAAGDITVLPGTIVNLAVTSTKALDLASMQSENGDVLEFSARPGGTTWHGKFLVWSEAANEAAAPPDTNYRIIAPSRYKLRLLDTDGYENLEPVWQPITLITDRAPTVSIISPGRDQQVTADTSLTVVVEARDDYSVGDMQIGYRVNNNTKAFQLAQFPPVAGIEKRQVNEYEWDLAATGINAGDVVQYWAMVADRNIVTGPGYAESRRFSIFVVTPAQEIAELEIKFDDYAEVLEQLIRLQRENRAQTASGVEFETLVERQVKIRTNTAVLAGAMREGTLPVATMIDALEDLHTGLMAQAVHQLEIASDIVDAARAGTLRDDSLPVQAEIIEELEELLRRLQRNKEARRSLRRIRKTDKAAHKEVTNVLAKIVSGLDRRMQDETELASKLEKMPKKPVDEFNEEDLNDIDLFEDFNSKWRKWKKGTIDELAKLPTGFVDDFGLRTDINTVFEEVEAKERKAGGKHFFPIEEIASNTTSTNMQEDLEIWLLDEPDYFGNVLEEPLGDKRMNYEEIPLPDTLRDLIGELLQEEEEFDEEADDETTAWGDNLEQAGWNVMDGPQSNFSAKGVTGNDLPNKNELGGRSGDGRQGKSSGQMVGEIARGLEGRDTEARLGNDRYEEGKLEEEGRLDPKGSTGGGKKAGSGNRGLQGGTPPDFLKDMERLSAKQAGMREKAERIVKELDTSSLTGRRLKYAINLMQSVEKDFRDLKYDDAARKRKIAINHLRAAAGDLDETVALSLHRARELPVAMREELLQSSDEGYPEGYESLLQKYFRTLAEAEK